MDSDKYSNFSLIELYELYSKMNQENNSDEANLISVQITIKEKVEKSVIKLASLSDRLAAALVDMVIVGLPIFLTLILLYGFSGIQKLATKYGLLYTLIMLLIGQGLYLVINGRLLYKYGQTVGKRYLEIKIVDLENKLPNIHVSYGLRYFIPALFPLIPILGALLSLIDILIIFKKDRRCLHDHIAGTQVIDVA